MTRVLSLLLYLIAASAHGDEAAILDKDFRIMMEWFPGVYDNQEQVYFEEQQGIDEALRHERLSSSAHPAVHGHRPIRAWGAETSSRRGKAAHEEEIRQHVEERFHERESNLADGDFGK